MGRLTDHTRVCRWGYEGWGSRTFHLEKILESLSFTFPILYFFLFIFLFLLKLVHTIIYSVNRKKK